MNKKKLTMILSSLLLVCAIGIAAYCKITDCIYEKNCICVCESLPTIILDKYEKEGDYYLKVFIETGIEEEQDNIRSYKLIDQKLYNAIDIENNEKYPEIVFKANIPKDELPLEVDKIIGFSNQQKKLILNPLYTEYITIIEVGKGEEW